MLAARRNKLGLAAAVSKQGHWEGLLANRRCPAPGEIQGFQRAGGQGRQTASTRECCS